MTMKDLLVASFHVMIIVLSTLAPLAATSSTPTVTIPPGLTSFPTTLTKTQWTSLYTSTQYPNPALPLYSEQQWVVTTIVAVYEPWLSAPTSFPYTLIRTSETTLKNELRITSDWRKPVMTMTLLSDSWTASETLVLGG